MKINIYIILYKQTKNNLIIYVKSVIIIIEGVWSKSGKVWEIEVQSSLRIKNSDRLVLNFDVAKWDSNNIGILTIPKEKQKINFCYKMFAK